MSRLVAPRFVLQNCRNVYKGIFAKYSVDTGSKEHIDRLIKGKKVVVFMKGIPEEPRCGFSRLVILILNAHGVKDFDYYDVLEDEKLRKGIKDYSNWPTIPQVYIGEEFMGGCDVMQDMHKTGELIEELKKVGIRSALLDREDSNEKS